MSDRTITKAELIAWCDRNLAELDVLAHDAQREGRPVAAQHFYAYRQHMWHCTRREIECDEPWRVRP